MILGEAFFWFSSIFVAFFSHLCSGIDLLMVQALQFILWI